MCSKTLKSTNSKVDQSLDGKSIHFEKAERRPKILCAENQNTVLSKVMSVLKQNTYKPHCKLDRSA